MITACLWLCMSLSKGGGCYIEQVHPHSLPVFYG